MAEGRRIHGEGMENLADYVEERATYASDSNEYAEANRTLKRELNDIQALENEPGATIQQPDEQALDEETTLPAGRMAVSRDDQDMNTTIGTNAGISQLTPEDEARARINDTDNTRFGGNNLDR